MEFGGPMFPYISPNQSTTFEKEAARYRILPGDTLRLMIFNNDNKSHSFTIRGGGQSSPVIPAGNSASWDVHFSNPGIYQFADESDHNDVLGLSGMIIVWRGLDHEFYWSLREHQSDLNANILAGQPFDPDDFAPDYFTVNEKSHPEVQNDSAAVISGKVGDSIYIFLSNQGLMDHSIHFHGYHIQLVYSSINNWQLDWIKDSLPIKAQESQIYLLVPHQEGTFPVHDHNLVATTIGGNAPGGMLVLFTIDP